MQDAGDGAGQARPATIVDIITGKAATEGQIVAALEHERRRREEVITRPYKEQLELTLRQRDELSELVGALEAECEKFRKRARDLETQLARRYTPPAQHQRKEADVEPVERFEKFVGVKLVEARPKPNQDGDDGYLIVYEDGYRSWSPKEAFEKAYMRWDDPFQVSDETLQRFVYDKTPEKWSSGDSNIAGVLLTSRVGTHHRFGNYYGPALVITNSDEAQDTAYGQALAELRKALRFVAAWARNGLLGK